MVGVSFWGAQSGVIWMLLGRKRQKCQAALNPPKNLGWRAGEDKTNPNKRKFELFGWRKAAERLLLCSRWEGLGGVKRSGGDKAPAACPTPGLFLG